MHMYVKSLTRGGDAQVNANSERLSRSHFELSELQFVLEKAASFFDTARLAAQREAFDQPAASEAMDAPLLESAQPVDAKVRGPAPHRC